MRRLVREIEDRRGVDCVTHIASLEVEVRTGGTAGRTAEADRIACANNLIRFNQMFVEVTINGFESVRVTNDHIVTITLGLVVCQSDLAVESGVDGVVAADCEVNTFVHTAETSTISVVGCDSAGTRHMISGHVNHL